MNPSSFPVLPAFLVSIKVSGKYDSWLIKRKLETDSRGGCTACFIVTPLECGIVKGMEAVGRWVGPGRLYGAVGEAVEAVRGGRLRPKRLYETVGKAVEVVWGGR